jgi:hypothetical protein
MNPIVFASAMALFRATLSSADPLFPTDGTAGGPVPVNGVWAGLPADCQTPTSLDLSTWPKCATPVGFLDGEIAVLEKPGPDRPAKADQFYSIARTRFWTIKGEPSIVQVDVPILFNHTTIYIALKPDAVNEEGGFVSAVGWPIGCPATAAPGIAMDGKHCVASTPEAVRAAAATEPDAAKTYRLVRINAAATTATPDTGAPATAPSVAPAPPSAPAAASDTPPAPLPPAPTPPSSTPPLQGDAPKVTPG